jgi:hypothetical protein
VGIVSALLGLRNSSISLFSFGLYLIGMFPYSLCIRHMIRRSKDTDVIYPDQFEKNLLRITCNTLYIFTIAIISIVLLNIYKGYHPVNTFWGIFIAIISVFSTLILRQQILKIGKRFPSQLILTGTGYTEAYLYPAFVLLFFNTSFEMTQIGWLDSTGALLIGIIFFKVGRKLLYQICALYVHDLLGA